MSSDSSSRSQNIPSHTSLQINLHTPTTTTNDDAKPMPLPPNTTPAPSSIFELGMSPATQTEDETPAAPTTSALPKDHPKAEPSSSPSSSSSLSSKEFFRPKLRVHLEDLAEPGSSVFLGNTHAATLFPSAVSRVQKLLYVSPDTPGLHMPPTRSVTLVVRSLDGVAHTIGKPLDPEHHKEIHLSTGYVAGIASHRRAHEIEGVLVHELVHCYQWNGKGAAPGGLIEGFADWVRLRCGLSPPHWHRGDELKGKWDAGYQNTAYFLEYLEERFGEGTVRRLNEALRTRKYEEKEYWTGVLGRPVEQLWGDYKEKMEKESKK
ncbi:BSP-domain-containing protein [Xylariaceae sp. FL0255]|nr:BSP-domain-containing protein [Xylariaceae sp. FL0255]